MILVRQSGEPLLLDRLLWKFYVYCAISGSECLLIIGEIYVALPIRMVI